MASRLKFDWVARTAEADLVKVEAYPMVVEAQNIKIEPGRWELTNVKIMECGVKPAFYSMWSPSVIIRPGQNTVAKQRNSSRSRSLGKKLRRFDVIKFRWIDRTKAFDCRVFPFAVARALA
jgi:hypothetical protein